MKNSIKRAQSQARLSFAERENQRSLAGGKSNFRPKVRQLKKTLLTLVALLAVTTGAWAQTPELLVTIESNGKGTSSQTFDGKAILTFGGGKVSNDNDNWGWYNFSGAEEISLTVTGADGYTVTSCTFYTNSSSKTVEGEHPTVYVTGGPSQTYTATGKGGNSLGVYGVTKIEVYGYAASSGPKVDGPTTVDGKPQWSFTMPGGNVTLEPEYYPQATAAEDAVTAADADARATTDDPLVKVDATKLTGAKKLMYFVSNSGTNAPAYDAEGWTDQLPTAEGFTQQGIVYVWYYPVGTDEGVDEATATYSDGDICKQSITARIGAAPTYAVTFADGVNPEPPAEPEWTASPAANVTKGQPVTVTYTGSKKVIGVKAEKKAAAAPRPLAEAVAEDLGKIAGADGNIYDTKAAAEAANTTAVAMIAYVGSASDCTHGLAIALADESGTKTWSEAGAACSGKTAVTGGTWRLPSIKDWQYMFIGCGASGSYSDSPSTMSYSELATKLTTANGTALQTVSYWSSTESSPGEDAWSLYFGGSSASFFSGDYEGDAYPIRACLVF